MKTILPLIIIIGTFLPIVSYSPQVHADSGVLKDLEIKKDEVEGITWYLPKYPYGKPMALYIAKTKHSKPWLRLYFRCYANWWLFIDSLTIKIDDKMFELPAFDVDEEPVSGRAMEAISYYVEKREYEIIKAVISSSRTLLRFNGEKSYKDVVINVETKASLQKMLDAYQALGGTLDFE